MGKIQAEWSLGWQVWFVPYCKLLVGLGTGSTATWKFCNLYQHLCFETIFPNLKMTENCYLQYIFFLENWQFNHRLTPPLLCHMLYWKTILTIWQNMKARGLQKSQFFKWFGKNLEVQPRLLKDANFPSLSWIGKELKVYTAQDRHLKSKFWIYRWTAKIYVLI